MSGLQRISKSDNGDSLTPDIFNSSTFGNQLSLRVDDGVGAMSISPSYRDIVLASRSGLFIVDLDDPFSPPRYLPHRTSWEVADVQWSPHASKPNWVISTSNQKALVWNLSLASEKAVEYVLHGHNRAITDINFSQDPEILATCSVDSFVHVWDMRDPQKPAVSFADWYTGATQVKFNRGNPNIIGSTHDKTLYIWDKRKGSRPLHKIDAHGERINGLDFNRVHESKLLTSSNDFTVKVWDYAKSDTQPEAIIKTDFPVWRARHTPFGEGCAIMPLRGGNNSVFLHDLKDIHGNVEMTATHEFKGHTQPVREFLWRSRGNDPKNEDREFQLVTWSKDNDLRLWPVNQRTLETVHYKKGSKIEMKISRRGAVYETYRQEPVSENFWQEMKRRTSKGNSFTGTSNPLRRDSVFMTSARPKKQNPLYNVDKHEGDKGQLNWISGVRIGKSAFDRFEGLHINSAAAFETPGNLGEEVSLVGHKFPKIKLEKISVATGEIILSLNGPWGEDEELAFLRVEFLFPQNYPLSAPDIKIEEDESISQDIHAKMSSELAKISEMLSARGKYSLEMCLRYLLGDKISLEDVEKQLEEFENNFGEIEDIFDDVVFASSDEDGESISGAIIDDEADDDDADDDLDDDLVGIRGTTMKKNNTDNTPLPKQCGAIWSKNGLLICFFPNRKDKFKVPLSTMKVAAEFADDKDEQTPDDDSDSFVSDSDEDFGAHSKWISGPSGRALFNSGRNLYNFRHRIGHSGSGQPMSLTEKSQGTQNTVEITSKNFVHIHDFRYLMPARRELAAEYQVLGQSAEELARENGRIAEKHGCIEIAETWKLLELLLSKNVSFFDRLVRISTKQSKSQLAIGEIIGKFQWGSHPFGHSWLIKELFSYYESEKNIQMLAMMSCVLTRHGVAEIMSAEVTKRPGKIEFKNTEYQFIPSADSTMSLTHTPLKSPFHHDLLCRDNSTSYFGNVLSYNSSISPLDIPTGEKRVDITGLENSTDISAPSSEKDSGYLPAFFYSPERTISTPIRSLSRRTTGTHSQNISSENSPRENKGGGSPITANILKLASLRGQRPTFRRMDSDQDGKSISHINSRASFYSTDSNAGAVPVLTTPNVSLQIVNHQLMDDMERIPSDGAGFNEYFMGAEMKAQCLLYRSHYSAMLYNWGLEVESLEVLKFNFVNAYRALSTDKIRPNKLDEYHSPVISMRSLATHSAADAEMILTPDYAANRTFPKICQYCGLIIHTRFMQCGRCEHVLHAHCGEEWWLKGENEECPTGCGCNCVSIITYAAERIAM